MVDRQGITAELRSLEAQAPDRPTGTGGTIVIALGSNGFSSGRRLARPAPVVWLIFTADDAKTREKDLGPWLTVGTELERREFVRTTVVKIEFNRETIHRSER